MNCSYIALGSNLEQPQAQVNQAVDEIAAIDGAQIIAVSRWYQSSAVGPGSQPDYINGVLKLHCPLTPLALLDQLQAIENRHLRKRVEHWGPRTLDLDILLIDELQINLPRLSVPHPRMLERNFVLYPLFDIAPQLILPNSCSLRTQLQSCTMDGLHLVDPPSSPTMPSSTP